MFVWRSVRFTHPVQQLLWREHLPVFVQPGKHERDPLQCCAHLGVLRRYFANTRISTFHCRKRLILNGQVSIYLFITMQRF